MGFKKLDPTGGETIVFDTKGQDFEGTLTDIRKVTTKMGDALVADFEVADGSRCSLFLSTVLERLVNGNLVGRLIRIEYLGEVKNPKSGRTYKDFTVEVWED
jgi:hypothetical protein